jgi:DNA polymerase-3 subunit delta'
VLDLLGQLPTPDRRALHALSDALAGTEAQTLRTFLDTINAWLAARLSNGAQDNVRNVRVATAWQRINNATQEADTYNLDRRPLVFAVFGWLAEAART